MYYLRMPDKAWIMSIRLAEAQALARERGVRLHCLDRELRKLTSKLNRLESKMGAKKAGKKVEPSTDIAPLAPERIPLDVMAQMSPVEFFQRVYSPSRISSRSGSPELRRTAKEFTAWAGSTVTIGNLCDDLVTSFMRHCLNRGQSPTTTNNKRARILALCLAETGHSRATPRRSALPRESRPAAVPHCG
jgi:hypothetical protein